MGCLHCTCTGKRWTRARSGVCQLRLERKQKRWSTFDRELWAIVRAVREFRHYFGLSSFTIITDPVTNASRYISEFTEILDWYHRFYWTLIIDFMEQSSREFEALMQMERERDEEEHKELQSWIMLMQTLIQTLQTGQTHSAHLTISLNSTTQAFLPSLILIVQPLFHTLILTFQTARKVTFYPERRLYQKEF